MCVGRVSAVSFPRGHWGRESLFDLLQGVQDGGLQFGLSRVVGEAVQAGCRLLVAGADGTEGVGGTGVNFQDRIACGVGQCGGGLERFRGQFRQRVRGEPADVFIAVTQATELRFE